MGRIHFVIVDDFGQVGWVWIIANIILKKCECAELHRKKIKGCKERKKERKN